MRQMAASRSYRQGLQISDALFRQIHVLLDEVVLHAANLCRLEGLGPVDAALPQGRPHAGATCRPEPGGLAFWWWWRRGIEVHVLEVHRNEAARILDEVLVGH